MRAFEEALTLGVDAIELDCQLSADGELVVIHDETLERTTDGIGPVCAQPWAALGALDAGGWKDARFRGLRMPRLAEVLELIDGRVLLNVELKAAGDVARIEAPVTALVRTHAAESWVVFSSMHVPVLRGVRAAAPWAQLGIVWPRAPLAPVFTAAEELGAGCVAPSRTLVDASAVAAAHARGLGVWVWTVNAPREIRRLDALGVDAMFSDYPERLPRSASAPLF